MILVLAGTSEGREIITGLARAGYRVAASSVTAYGAELAARSGAELSLCGRLDEPALERVLMDLKAAAVVDATHPYAEEITGLARRVSQRLGRPYLRFRRKGGGIPDSPLVVWAPDYHLASKEALRLSGGGTILLTTGVKRLNEFVSACRPGARLAVRILPNLESLKRCLDLGFQPNEILAAQGPFSRESNRQQFTDFEARVVVTKDGGSRGGLPEKVMAALDLGIWIIVIRSPESLSDDEPVDLETVLNFAQRTTAVTTGRPVCPQMED